MPDSRLFALSDIVEYALKQDMKLDGYQLIRQIGSGGFGEVWLCRSSTIGDLRALKFIPAKAKDHHDQEYSALVKFRQIASKLHSSHIVAIEHINRNEHGFFYIMPLADGMDNSDPMDNSWQPASLLSHTQQQSQAGQWFDSQLIKSLILSILQGLQELSDTGVVHRDIKPENILIFNGKPRICDMSLLGEDAEFITRRGTPGYSTPSWYEGGHPDMYGAAATLYHLLTGNAPDKMGRSAFLWPPQGESSLNQVERTEWVSLHKIIRRATEEEVSERFVDFTAMSRAILNEPSTPFRHAASVSASVTQKRNYAAPVITLCVVAGIAIFIWAMKDSLFSDKIHNSDQATSEATTIPEERNELENDQAENKAIHSAVTKPELEPTIKDREKANPVISTKENVAKAHPAVAKTSTEKPFIEKASATQSKTSSPEIKIEISTVTETKLEKVWEKSYAKLNSKKAALDLYRTKIPLIKERLFKLQLIDLKTGATAGELSTAYAEEDLDGKVSGLWVYKVNPDLKFWNNEAYPLLNKCLSKLCVAKKTIVVNYKDVPLEVFSKKRPAVAPRFKVISSPKLKDAKFYYNESDRTAFNVGFSPKLFGVTSRRTAQGDIDYGGYSNLNFAVLEKVHSTTSSSVTMFFFTEDVWQRMGYQKVDNHSDRDRKFQNSLPEWKLKLTASSVYGDTYPTTRSSKALGIIGNYSKMYGYSRLWGPVYFGPWFQMTKTSNIPAHYNYGPMDGSNKHTYWPNWSGMECYLDSRFNGWPFVVLDQGKPYPVRFFQPRIPNVDFSGPYTDSMYIPLAVKVPINSFIDINKLKAELSIETSDSP